MLIQFKKGNHRVDVLHCTRPDGTHTWAKIPAGMMIHELIHLAVEKELGYRNAFYGLLAKGFDITDFERSREEKPVELMGKNLPEEAIWAEHIVHMFTSEHFQGSSMEDIGEQIENNIHTTGHKSPAITTNDLDNIRNSIQALAAEWSALSPGDMMQREYSC